MSCAVGVVTGLMSVLLVLVVVVLVGFCLLVFWLGAGGEHRQDMYGNIFTPEVEAYSNILGAEASSWSENCDAANVDERVFHRLPPYAERLWSPPAVSQIWPTIDRMSEFRCKALRRGVRAGPSQPAYCDVAPASGKAPGKTNVAPVALIVACAVLGVATVVLAGFVVYFFKKLRRFGDSQHAKLLPDETPNAQLIPGDASGTAASA